MNKDEVARIRQRAIVAFNRAILNGTIPRITKDTKCIDCGGQAYGYDHRSYYEPLVVEPVCRKCNYKRGPADPVPDDWRKHKGCKWNSLNDGDGEDSLEWMNGHVIDNMDIAIRLNERLAADADVAIAFDELSKLRKSRKIKVHTYKNKAIVLDGDSLYRPKWISKIYDKQRRQYVYHKKL